VSKPEEVCIELGPSEEPLTGACRRMQVNVKVNSSSFGRRRMKVGGPPERLESGSCRLSDSSFVQTRTSIPVYSLSVYRRQCPVVRHSGLQETHWVIDERGCDSSRIL